MISLMTEKSFQCKNILISSATITQNIIYTLKLNLIIIFLKFVSFKITYILLADILICPRPNRPIFNTSPHWNKNTFI